MENDAKTLTFSTPYLDRLPGTSDSLPHALLLALSLPLSASFSSHSSSSSSPFFALSCSIFPTVPECVRFTFKVEEMILRRDSS